MVIVNYRSELVFHLSTASTPTIKTWETLIKHCHTTPLSDAIMAKIKATEKYEDNVKVQTYIMGPLPDCNFQQEK